MKDRERIPAVLIALLFLVAVCLARYAPEAAFREGLASRTSLRPLHVMAALLLFAGFKSRSRTGTALVLATTLGLAALNLAGIWGTGASSGAFIGGLIPFSDAGDYLHCSRLVAEGSTFEHLPICSRRPLFIAFLAGLQMATGENLRLVNLILVVVTIAASCRAGLQVQALYGSLASTIFLLILSLFYRRFVGALLTEHLGLTLGALGFTLLLKSAESSRASTFLIGCLSTALALSARAGAFFVLPLLAFWGARFFRREALVSVRVMTAAIGLMALALGSSVGLSAALGRADGAFSNFSYVLYGLLSGGGWGSALRDHPEIRSLDSAEQAARIYGLAFALLKSDPLSLARGALRAWGAFLGSYPFGFVGRPVALLLMVMAMIGVARAGHRRAAADTLLLAMALGILLSVPFAPPWDASAMRAYAPTLPVIAMLPALGLGRLRAGGLVVEDVQSSPRGAIVGVMVVLGACLLPPILGRTLGVPIHRPTRSPNCQVTVHPRVAVGSFVDVLPGRGGVPSRFAVGGDDFRAGFRELGRPSLARELASLTPPFRLVSALGVGPAGLTEFLLVTTSDSSPADGLSGVACAAPPSSPDLRGYNLAYLQRGLSPPTDDKP